MNEPRRTSSKEQSRVGFEHFNRDEFADRTDELKLIQSRVQAASRGAGGNLLVWFFALMGQGKSWLLSYLRWFYSLPTVRMEKRKPLTFTTRIDFAELSGLDHGYSLLRWMTTQIEGQLGEESGFSVPDTLRGDELPTDKDREAVTADFVNWVNEWSKKFTPLLIFDTSEHAEESLLDWLEEAIVYPILRTNRAVFVFGGRRLVSPARFDVRRRVEAWALQPLDVEEGLPAMLEFLKVNPSLKQVFYDFSFGHPMTTKAIFKALLSRAEGGAHIDEALLCGAASDIHQAIQTDVIEPFFLREAVGKLYYLREILWAACVPRKFNTDSLRSFLVRFLGDDYARKGSFFHHAIRDLQDITLAGWSSDVGGYILDPVLRHVMACNLRGREPNTFVERHQKAANLYDEWIEQHPRKAVSFLIERSFHRAWALRVVGKEEASTVGKEFGLTWKEMSRQPDVQWDLPEIVKTLNTKIGEDREFREVFPTLHANLLHQAQNIKDRLVI